MSAPRLVILCRGGRASIPGEVWTRLEEIADITLVQRNSAPAHDEAVALLHDADIVGSTNVCLPPIDSALLDALPRLRGLVLYATGFDHLDVAELRRRGVGLSVLPDYATVAVAEHTVALLLALATRVHLAQDRSRGLVGPDTSLRGVELDGRTLGVIGVGRIGTRVAQVARGLGLRVVGHDTSARARAQAAAAGLEMLSLTAMLRQSDDVAVTASYLQGQAAVLGRRQLALLRPGAHVVNVGRPGLVDTPAVVAALRTGHLRGYAVDDVVISGQQDADLVRQGRLLQTGHSAWWRDEVLERGGQMWGEHLLAAVNDSPLDAVTWPQPVRPKPVTSSTGLVSA